MPAFYCLPIFRTVYIQNVSVATKKQKKTAGETTRVRGETQVSHNVRSLLTSNGSDKKEKNNHPIPRQKGKNNSIDSLSSASLSLSLPPASLNEGKKKENRFLALDIIGTRHLSMIKKKNYRESANLLEYIYANEQSI